MMRLPNTILLPAPEPATPTAGAAAARSLVAVSTSLEMALVRKLQLEISEVRECGAAKLLRLSSAGVSGCFSTTVVSDLFSS